jgi:hypothetical protein
LNDSLEDKQLLFTAPWLLVQACIDFFKIKRWKSTKVKHESNRAKLESVPLGHRHAAPVASFPGKLDANHRRRGDCFHNANIQVFGFQMRALFDVQFNKGVDFETRRFPVRSVGVFL